MTLRGQTILLAGATGTIGRAVAFALRDEGAHVLALVRGESAGRLPPGVEPVITEMESGALARLTLTCDAVISCLASRTGAPEDAWRIDHAAHLDILAMAQRAGARQFVLLSAICVQKPKLAFQRAKLAFEAALAESGMCYSIVRPTAYFKSLSGQLARLQAGKPFLMFGDGQRTACKPISDRDLARYMVACLNDPARQNRILPIGGPGPAQSPKQQGAALFAALGLEPRFQRVPFALMDGIVWALACAGVVSAKARAKAELARIGRYYASESMLVWDAQRGAYDADMTPETGQDRLEDFYAQLATGEAKVDLGEHAVF